MKWVIDIFNRIRREGLEGSFSRYYSVYRGFVSSNQDPDGLGRLKVVVPQVSGRSVIGEWAWPIGAYAGANYGVHIIPSVGDTVWVSFEYGDPKQPLWQHGYWGAGEKPADFKSTAQFGIVSPKGNKLIIRDDEEIIEVSDASGNTLVISSNFSKITYNNTVILLENDAIEHQSDTIFLGAKDDATHPVLKGDNTKVLIKNMLDSMKATNDQIVAALTILNPLTGNALTGAIALIQTQTAAITSRYLPDTEGIESADVFTK